MKNFLPAIQPFAFGLLLALPGSAQTADNQLTVGSEVNGALASGTVHSYSLEIATEQFVFGQADQQSVDVVVTVKGPDGDTVREFDRTARGADYFQFSTESAGLYTFEVRPFEQGEGDYSLTIQRIEAVGKTPEKRVDQIMSGYSGDAVPGGVVAFIQGGKTVFQRAYGMANLTHAIPFNTATVTNIGSTSKQFTCMAIMLLDAAGKLSIDDDVRKHIEELPDLGEPVTIRNLMTHTSGYREFLNALSMGGRLLAEGDYIDRNELVALVQRQPKLQNAPGAEWNYNNTGYGLLTLIVERTTGEPFSDFTETNIFAPLGMTDTVFRAERTQIIPNSSQGYLQDDDGNYKEVVDLGGALGAGGLYTTASDLARWIANFASHEVGGEAVYTAMTTPFTLIDGESTGYGFGLSVDEYRGQPVIHHGGADSAHRAMLIYFTELDAAVVALSNNGAFNSGQIAHSVADAFLEEHLDGKGDADEGTSNNDSSSEFDPETFQEFEGRFQFENLPLVLRIFREEDQFFAQATGQDRLEITPTSELSFNVAVVGASLIFHRNDNGDVESLTLNQGGEQKATRIADEPWKPSKDERAGYAGKYFSDELEAFYSIAIEDEELVLQHRRMDDVTLQAVKKDEFTGEGPIAEFMFERNGTGEVTGFMAANGRTRGVLFTKMKQ